MSIRKEGDIDPVGDQRKVLAAIEQELSSIGLDLERTAVDYLNSRGINVDGTIRDSVKSLVSRVIKGLRLEFGANAKHAIYVHEGTKPHWPPHDPIRQWVHKKLNPPADQIDEIAYMVQRKIAREGTKAQPFLAVAIRAHEQQFQPRIRKAIERAIQRN